MTTNNPLARWQTTTGTQAAAGSARAGSAESGHTPSDSGQTRSVLPGGLLGALRAIARFYRVNWARAAAQESEYLRIKEENLQKYWAQTGGRM